MHIRIASIMLVASILGIGAIAPVANAQTQQEDAIKAIAGGFESISVVQDANQIVITIAKTGEGGGGPGNGTVPTEPIVIIPPNNETGQNGTIITPPLQNQTGNVTLPEQPPVIVIDPDGNNTVVQPPSNVTVIDNGTVIVAPPDRNITETPGNVTVIDPPAPPVGNVTEPGVPGECGCPIDGGAIAPGDNVTGVEPTPAPPVDVNQNITVEQPAPEPAPAPEEGGGNGDGGGGDGNGNGGDGNGGG